MDYRTFATYRSTSADKLQQYVARRATGSATIPLAIGDVLDKSLATVWPGWYSRAEAKKKELKKTDQDLAEEVSEAVGYDVSRPLVNAWLNGTRIPRLTEFMALCAALGADPGEVLFEVKIIHKTLPSASSATVALKEPAPTPEYLVKQSKRIRQFKATRRRIKILR